MGTRDRLLSHKNPLKLDFGPFDAREDRFARGRKRHGDKLLERVLHAWGVAFLVLETKGALCCATNGIAEP